uniref:UPF0729 protein n=1 Tax=Strongyloides stercoralis TaxID=6248 RepID=A0A0K0EB60_STRER
MVCLPCVILPIVLAFYLKFIQPIVLKYAPERWKAKLDSLLYPTCSVNIQQQQPNTANEEKDAKSSSNDNSDNVSSCTKEENKKDI